MHVFRGYSVGAVDYLFKPFTPEILQSKVAVFVELFTKREALKRQAEALQSARDELEERVRARTERAGGGQRRAARRDRRARPHRAGAAGALRAGTGRARDTPRPSTG